MNYVVIDLEFNGRRHYEIHPMEIIEIGAVKLNETVEIMDTFQSYVRPRFPIQEFALDFCGIDRGVLEASDPFPQVIRQFIDFCGGPCTLVAWGGTDFFQLLIDCKSNGIPTDWISGMIDMSKYYNGGLQQALIEHHMEFSGKQHSALDDALQACRLLLMHKELVLTNNNYKPDQIKMVTGGIKKKIGMALSQAAQRNQVLTWEEFSNDEETQQYVSIMKLTEQEMGYIEHMFHKHFKQVYGRRTRARLRALGIDI
ncbi:3'-5' exonuclease [Paenibacillus filicis]|uniref:3'-5' exonuclease n=1 Tax=Paenibacillus filicis TaxID=669464 RepID=A0ABU9DUI1_9BACL